ncbi:hypothetical protein O1D97_03295 [Marinomonas sp. 15G1-11]|uniref:EamA-like transporter family protein n=1 Tax=Marinomonas phaeophyticola TaxID=3004091 RepID=A0ABT4JQT7_9GAMM|nr:hypothetical protein [Marinomonas sp. 15G1-11]MCZ2720694.1 hypothetical protein [Marinomonas sp. 15G1-11]
MSDNKATNVILGTSLALIAFAGNSILCRLALGHGAIDAYGFTLIRLFSGAITLVILWWLVNKVKQGQVKDTNLIELTQFGSWKGDFICFYTLFLFLMLT